MNDRVAIYAGTRNLYPQMYTALKSLLINNSMDRVFLLIEDDEFPIRFPSMFSRLMSANRRYSKRTVQTSKTSGHT